MDFIIVLYTLIVCINIYLMDMCTYLHACFCIHACDGHNLLRHISGLAAGTGAPIKQFGSLIHSSCGLRSSPELVWVTWVKTAQPWIPLWFLIYHWQEKKNLKSWRAWLWGDKKHTFAEDAGVYSVGSDHFLSFFKDKYGITHICDYASAVSFTHAACHGGES